MPHHRFLIPLTTFTLSISQGCRDPMVGEWELVEVDGQDWPLDETYSYDGYTFDLEGEASMTVDADLTGKFEMDVDIRGEGYSYSYSYNSDVEVEVKKRGASYRIEVDGDINTDFECSMENGTLSCEDDDEVDFEFEKVGK